MPGPSGPSGLSGTGLPSLSGLSGKATQPSGVVEVRRLYGRMPSDTLS